MGGVLISSCGRLGSYQQMSWNDYSKCSYRLLRVGEKYG
jgi:hypothetical protein